MENALPVASWFYSHCDREDVAGGCDGHTCAEDHLLTVTVKDTVVRVPQHRKGKGDVDILVGFSAYEHKQTYPE